MPKSLHGAQVVLRPATVEDVEHLARIRTTPKVYDAVRTLARHLITDHRHHRLVIDPATDNAAAIACYRKVGFRPVGVMRQYERSPDGGWHDGLLMDLLADEFIDRGAQ